LRRSKNENCSKWGNEALGASGNSKTPSFRGHFLFFLIFHPLFYIVAFNFTYLHLLKNSKVFCGVFLYQLEIYQFIYIFFKIDNTTSVVWLKPTWCHIGFSQTIGMVLWISAKHHVGFLVQTDVVVDYVTSVV